MKKTILSLVFLFSVAAAFSQDAPPVTDAATYNSVQAVSGQVAALNNSVDSLNGKLNNLMALSAAGSDMVDSSALENAEKHPEQLYTNMFRFTNCMKNSGWVWFRFLASMVLLACIIYYGMKYCIETTLCRDAGFSPSGTVNNVKALPYSYSRIQLFWWTMIILSCYTYFYGLTGTLAPLNPTSVILLGFGAVVLAGSKLIDTRQQANTPAGQRIQDADATHDSFITDIISDDYGPSIHRFQAVIFNIVFGMGFISFFISALYGHRYPFVDFSEWQFALIGISSATYLGMKATENGQQPQAAPAPPPPPPPAPPVVNNQVPAGQDVPPAQGGGDGV